MRIPDQPPGTVRWNWRVYAPGFKPANPIRRIMVVRHGMMMMLGIVPVVVVVISFLVNPSGELKQWMRRRGQK